MSKEQKVIFTVRSVGEDCNSVKMEFDPPLTSGNYKDVHFVSNPIAHIDSSGIADAVVDAISSSNK